MLKRLLINFSLILASLLVGLLILEGLMRVVEVVTRPAHIDAEVDELGFEKLQANFDGSALSRELKRDVHVKTNAEGFVGRDYPLEKPSSTVRVALLGDSFVDARTVDWESSFAYLLEEAMNNDQVDRDFEFMNFGISGADTLTEMLYFHYYAAKYNPDYVVLFFYPNDIEGNTRYLSTERSEWFDVRPETYNRPTDLKAKLLSNSFLIRFVDEKVKNNPLLVRLAIKIGLYSENILTAVPQDGIHPTFFMYHDPLSETNIDAYELTKELIISLQDLVNGNGSKFILVYMPEARQVDERLWEQLRVDVPKLNDYQWDLNQPNNFLTENFPDMLDLTEVFKEEFANNPGVSLYNQGAFDYYRDGHLSEEGHKLTSQTFLKFFERIEVKVDEN